MPYTFEFRILKDEWTPGLKKLEGLPEAMGDAGHEICRVAQAGLRREISRQDIIDTKQLWERTEARRLSKIRSVVFVPLYGIWLDSMKPHIVALKRGRNITRWAMKARNSPWQGMKPKQLPKYIMVHPHPWIDRPIESTLRRSEQILEKHIRPIMS